MVVCAPARRAHSPPGAGHRGNRVVFLFICRKVFLQGAWRHSPAYLCTRPLAGRAGTPKGQRIFRQNRRLRRRERALRARTVSTPDTHTATPDAHTVARPTRTPPRPTHTATHAYAHTVARPTHAATHAYAHTVARPTHAATHAYAHTREAAPPRLSAGCRADSRAISGLTEGIVRSTFLARSPVGERGFLRRKKPIFRDFAILLLHYTLFF